jgi:hypothetical protein
VCLATDVFLTHNCVSLVVGLLLLKKSAIAVPLMVPLIVITVLFSSYIKQMHFRVAEYLPVHACKKVDASNPDLCFLDKAFTQPELQDKILLPDVDDKWAQELFDGEPWMTDKTHSVDGDVQKLENASDEELEDYCRYHFELVQSRKELETP